MFLKMHSLTNEIKTKATELGFSKLGIAKPETLTLEGKYLFNWLSNSFHGEMEWMSKFFDKRMDPRLVLPEIKSIVIGGFNYYSDHHHKTDEQTGKISRYAWVTDYHEILKYKLEKLLGFIKEKKTGVEGKIYADTGPVMEKAWARKAGLGWMGKNTIIITREFGSWFFLGVILLNVELEADVPINDYCGTCNRCIEACPTKAIIAPYVLDSRKCISYLNIEQKGNIDETLAEKFNNWIYGCDICQDVCPWNKKFAKVTSISDFISNRQMREVNLSKFQGISPIDFNTLFKNSPVKRIKHKKFLENLRVVQSSNQKGKENECKTS
jgi:epoxyqueuosine reductase